MSEMSTATSPLIYSKIPAIMADIASVPKNRKNAQQGYEFRGIDDMYNSLHGAFAKHGVFFTTRILNKLREERPTRSGGVLIYTIMEVEFSFYAADGSSVRSVVTGEASDSGDKSSNKAMSTALKYALMQLLLVPTADVKDTEYESPEFAVKPQVIVPMTALPKASEPEPAAEPLVNRTATKVQLDLITNLLKNGVIGAEERDKMLAALPALTKERAARTIENLMATIAERKEAEAKPTELRKAS